MLMNRRKRISTERALGGSRLCILLQSPGPYGPGNDDELQELNGAKWGLPLHWWKKDVPPSLTFNARSEEAAEKPTWRHSLRGMRCLMPARGWYEWNENEQVRSEAGRKVKQPYFISLPDADFMAFAGLWAVWQGQDGSQIPSYALLSKTAAPSIAHIHDRMPDVLKPDHLAAWLDPKTQGRTSRRPSLTP